MHPKNTRSNGRPLFEQLRKGGAKGTSAHKNPLPRFAAHAWVAALDINNPRSIFFGAGATIGTLGIAFVRLERALIEHRPQLDSLRLLPEPGDENLGGSIVDRHELIRTIVRELTLVFEADRTSLFDAHRMLSDEIEGERVLDVGRVEINKIIGAPRRDVLQDFLGAS